MENLPNLLKKFSKLLDRKTAAKESVACVIKELTGSNLTTDKIFLQESVLEIHGSPILNNEIRLKEGKILEELRRSHKLFISRVLYK